MAPSPGAAPSRHDAAVTAPAARRAITLRYAVIAPVLVSIVSLFRPRWGSKGSVPRTTLPPHSTSPAAGRRFVADVLWQRGFSTEVIDDAVLLTSEAVTNAVVHAGTPIDVVVTVDAAMARIEVHDGHPGIPVVRDPAPDAASGRGLRVIDSVAEAWGVRRSDHGTCLWFEMRP